MIRGLDITLEALDLYLEAHVQGFGGLRSVEKFSGGWSIGRERWVAQRGAGNPSRSNMPTTYHSEPYASPDLFLFDGNANQVIYFIPSEDLIIIRLGDAPPEDASWDNAYLPNLILRDLKNNAGRER